MKKTLTLIFFLFLIQNQFIAQTCPGQTLCTQSDVDNMSCSYINGYTLIGHGNPAVCGGSTNISNLSNFSSVTTIKDGLIITDNPNLNTLTGMGNITQIGDSGDNIEFQNNTSLTDISALNGVTNFNIRTLFFKNNGFNTITFPTNLTTLSGSGQQLRIENETNLSSINYNNFGSINGNVDIVNCPNLMSVSGTSVTSLFKLEVENCASLTTLNFSGLTTASEIILQNNVGSINSLNFSSLNSINFSSGTVLNISNTSLTDMSGFSALQTVAGEVVIQNNSNLTSLDGLYNLTSVTEDLDIRNNPNLNDCCAILDLINNGGVSGNIILSGNGANCNSIAAIQANCPSCTGNMQVTDGPFSQEVIFSNVTSLTSFPFSINGGHDRLLIASMTHRAAGIASVSYNGTAMNLAVSHNPAGPSSYIYYLVLPGSASINGTFEITSSTNAFTYFVLNAIVVSCADVSSPLGNVTTQSPTGQSSSLSLSTSVNNLIVDAIAADANVTAWSVGSNQTTIHTATANSHAHASSYEIATTGSVPMSWTWTGGAAPYTHSAAEFLAAPVLPVELTEFKAQLKNENVQLNWITHSETQNLGFEIEHSQDTKNWRNIGFVNGNGSSSILQTYSFQHQSPESGINYYRLRQIDFDGNFEYSNIVSVHIRNDNSTPSLSIFPNPNDGQFQIQLHNPKEQSCHLQLFDSKGVVIVNQFLEDDFFEFETILPKGVYWVKAMFQGEVLMEKVVVH